MNREREVDYTVIKDERIRSKVCELMSEMLDNPDEHGIYPTSRFMSKMEDFIIEEKKADRIIAEEGKGLLGACEMAIKMLNYINCPECDGSGAKQISEDEVAQCQWCDEKNKIQQAIVGAENKQPQQPKLPEIEKVVRKNMCCGDCSLCNYDMEQQFTCNPAITRLSKAILNYLNKEKNNAENM